MPMRVKPIFDVVTISNYLQSVVKHTGFLANSGSCTMHMQESYYKPTDLHLQAARRSGVRAAAGIMYVYAPTAIVCLT